MSVEQAIRQIHPLARLRRGLVGMTDLRGRATRTDFFFGMIVLMMIGSALDWLIELGGGRVAQAYDSMGLYLVLLFVIAVMVRRLHDQNRSGWLSIVVLPILAIGAYEQYLFNIRELSAPRLDAPYDSIKLILVILFYGLALWPGSAGANRYGPDPRELRRTGA